MSGKEQTLDDLIDELTKDCNGKHVSVIQAVLSDKFSNNTDAYLSIFPDSSRDSARSSCAALLALPNNESLFKALQKLKWKKNIMTRDEAKAILSDMARTDINDLLTWQKVEIGQDDDGKKLMQSAWVLHEGAELNKAQMKAVKSVKSTPQGIVIELHDQKAAMKQLAEMEGWQAPIKTQDVTNDIADRLQGKMCDT